MIETRELLGEFEVDVADTPFANFQPSEWALYVIAAYGSIEGEPHKDWTLDQAARCLHGAPPRITRTEWSDGTVEYRIEPFGTTPAYINWVEALKDGENGPDTYPYSIGVAPIL